ncbi:DUF2381 family protein [Archangium gephyra]|uniref:DUF2381 family protein n=1 Tax=Archangium gephyra TaxID=48 RepID=UPI003B7893FA
MLVRLLTWLPLALLLTGPTASAQPPPSAREHQQRQVMVPTSPDEPVPEVRVAANVSTHFRFDASIDRELAGGGGTRNTLQPGGCR